ncbi:MAG TPA: helix-turn-helix domain-containing protein, partial [Roseiflexaceae bacterium]
MSPDTTFSRWLKQRRRALDLTQEELAQAVGYAVETIRKLEAGKRRPSKPLAERLAQLLRVPPAEQPAFLALARPRPSEVSLPPPALFHPADLTTGIPLAPTAAQHGAVDRTPADFPPLRTIAPVAGGERQPGIPLLATKLYVPRARPTLLARPRLLVRLDASLAGGRCTLLSAPAGAGKTSLLASWLAGVDRPVAWLSLDERDQDAHQLLRYLIAALQTIAPACGRTALAWLDAPPPPPSPETILTALVNDLAALPDPCLLVLDDYHLVRAPAIYAAVAFLLDHLPPPVHLVVATRADPPLPLPRMRARGQLAEVRAADLRFTPEEAAAFLEASMGLRLPEGQVTALVARTEGWAAGLQLAGLALRDRADPAAFVAAFAGSHRLVADYLTAEVIDQQPAPRRRFLLASSVLDRLCAPLCAALLAAEGDAPDAPDAAGDSQAVLEELERANLFLVALDDERRWYRYHHLFADALRARLAREAGAAGAAALHRRASGWFEQHGLLPEAIQHALAAGAVEDAATWIEALTPTLFATSGIHQALTIWLAALPDSVVRARPLLCLGQAWLLLHRFPPGPAAA